MVERNLLNDCMMCVGIITAFKTAFNKYLKIHEKANDVLSVKKAGNQNYIQHDYNFEKYAYV